MFRQLLLGLCIWASYPSISAQLTFEFDGVTRTYFMDAPDPIPEGAPLVFVLHGYSSSAAVIRTYSGWGSLAQSEGFVAVFPQGTPDANGVPHWNANLGISSTNDHGFLVALAQHLQGTHGLSPECTYSCGMSNGGFMSYSLACAHPEVFSAIGSVTGAMSAVDFGCTPSVVVPIVHLHGTDDLVVGYDSGTGGSWGQEGVPAIMDHWTELMGTTTLEETTLPNLEIVDLTSVDFLRHAGAPGGQEFHHYRVNGGGHDWFGAWGSQDVESTEILWEFFASACSGAFTGVAPVDGTEALVAIRERTVSALESCSLTAYDVLGRQTLNLQLTAGESWTFPDSGFRLILVTQSSTPRGTRTQTLKIH